MTPSACPKLLTFTRASSRLLSAFGSWGILALLPWIVKYPMCMSVMCTLFCADMR